MSHKQCHTILCSIVSFFLISLLVLAAFSPPAQAGSKLPPRETPGHQNDDDDDSDSREPAGAHIELAVDTAPPGAWSVVQWQDKQGNWQDVEGWQGPVSSNSRWWVAAKDFHTGPFRWAVLVGPGGRLVGASESFTLPQFPNETLRVEVTLAK